MKNFTLFTASRARPELLKQCIRSFFYKASDPNSIEFIFATDWDDPSYNDPELLELAESFDIKQVIRGRSKNFHNDYHNTCMKMAQGELIFGLNDECEIVETNWDRIIMEAYDRRSWNDEVAYIGVNDSTHTDGHINKDRGSCFPIVSKFAMETLGCYIPSEITMWGGDLAIYQVYKGVDRVIDIWDKITVLHHSSHNGTREKDYAFEYLNSISKKCVLTPYELAAYQTKLRSVLDD